MKPQNLKKSYDVPIRDIPYSPRKGRILYDYPHKREPHELDFANILVRFGFDILFIKPSIVVGNHTPDCEWRGKMWEIKTAMNIKLDNIVKLMKDAFKQSENVILDVSQYGKDMNLVVSEVMKYFTNPKNKHGIMGHEVLIIDQKCYCIVNKKVLKCK